MIHKAYKFRITRFFKK